MCPTALAYKIIAALACRLSSKRYLSMSKIYGYKRISPKISRKCTTTKLPPPPPQKNSEGRGKQIFLGTFSIMSLYILTFGLNLRLAVFCAVTHTWGSSWRPVSSDLGLVGIEYIHVHKYTCVWDGYRTASDANVR